MITVECLRKVLTQKAKNQTIAKTAKIARTVNKNLSTSP